MFFGEPVAVLWVNDVCAQGLSEPATVSSLEDEHVPSGSTVGDYEGRQEGKKHDLDAHVQQ
jgi:hypothetical protein